MIALKVTLLLCVLIAKGGIITPGPSSTTKSSSEAITREAILITGGHSADQSAEIFIPWQNSTCQLPPLPDKRWYHVQSGNTLCGGWDYSTRSCIQWSVQEGGWVTLPLNLTEDRHGSSVWKVSQDNSLVIMGGWSTAGEISETVSSDGVSTRRTFEMKYQTWHACSISLGDEVVITGGKLTQTRVSLYNRGGWVRNMPSLNTGRFEHGCTSYSTGGEQVLLVTGGRDDGYNKLDSTEVLRPESNWQEITSARLPRPMYAVRVITVNNRVLLFGGEDDDEDMTWTGHEDIMEYNKNGDSWSELGTINKGRSYHGLSVVSIADFPDCNKS